MIGRRLDSTLYRRNIVIGMLTAGKMNKQMFRHFQACKCTTSSLRTKICQMRNVKNRYMYHADRPRRTTRREDIDNASSFRRYRFLSSARMPGLVKMPRELGFVSNSSKTTAWCSTALTSPIRWCSVYLFT